MPYMLKLSSMYYEEMFAERETLERWWKRVRERPSVGLIVSYGLERP